MVSITIKHGEALETLRTMADNSVHSIVTDPPYEIGISAKGWDSTGIAYSVPLWKEALRVLKPGGALLCFGSSRTYFAVANSINEAGFEIKTSIAWLYNTGRYLSQDLGQRIEDEGIKEGEVTAVIRFSSWLQQVATDNNITAKDYQTKVKKSDMWGHYAGASQPAVPSILHWQEIKDNLLTPAGVEIPEWVEQLVKTSGKKGKSDRHAKRAVVEVVKKDSSMGGGKEKVAKTESIDYARTKAVTKEGQKWEGWSEGIAPAFEPIIVARKPNARLSELKANRENFSGYGAGTVSTSAQNIVEHGTGGYNHTACGFEDGRKVKNVLIDSELEEFVTERTDKVGFFYSPKASQAERPVTANGAKHSTVKPLALMRWLCALVTPPGGVVLDMFAGSGATLEAAALEGFECIGIELDAEHVELCEIRKQRVSEFLNGAESDENEPQSA